VDYRQLQSWLDGRSFADWRAQYDRDGYVVFPRVMSTREVRQVRTAVALHLDKTGRNDFEGFNSNRVYALLAKAPEVCSKMLIHPLVLGFVEAELGKSCLASALLAINLLPGETAQDWHHDDGHIRIPLPHPSYGVSAFWAIDDLTEDNGATEIIPGSHLFSPDLEKLGRTNVGNANGGHDTDSGGYQALRMVMPAGSVMIAKGTLWHRGGANKSQHDRLIITPQYCPGWARQIENMMAAVPSDVAASLPQRARQLLGYSIHDPFMGYVNGVHPERLLHRV